jgi:L-lysine exporter family protein LysE/ArgO|tara:strand:- start:112 stop:720 length:609 start_codon:yes stop_codon:yes gene_type:complete
VSFLILGFLTGLSLILALGAQNIFVIEQGLKKQFIFIVCLICALSDFLLIFLGIFLFQYFENFFSQSIELILNILLLLFLINFIWKKVKLINKKISINQTQNKENLVNIIFKTLGFTYLNPHVYSDTVFFLGNFSKSFLLGQKYLFGIGASLSSILFFFSLGYFSKYLSGYVGSENLWKIINYSIILFMSLLSIYVFLNIIK